MMLRIRSLVASLTFTFFLLLQSCVVENSSVRTDPPRVIVDADWGGVDFDIGTSAFRKLVAYTDGNVSFDSDWQGAIALRVNEVIKVEPGSSDNLQRAATSTPIRVVAINEIASHLASLPKGQGFSLNAQWTLLSLPNGLYIVEKINDISIKDDFSSERTDTILNDLDAVDPQMQLQAILSAKESNCVKCVSEIIPRLGDPTEVRLDGPCGFAGDVIYMCSTTIGTQARIALLSITRELRDRNFSGRDANATLWWDWWSDLLRADPFPEISVLDSERTPLLIDEPDMHIREVELSATGRQSFLFFSRRNYDPDIAHRGIMRINNEIGAEEILYSTPLANRNRRPVGLRSAWIDEAGALVWQEFYYDEGRGKKVKFMPISVTGEVGEVVDLNIDNVSHLELISLDEQRWGLIVTYTPDEFRSSRRRADREDKNLYLLVLDRAGSVLRRVDYSNLRAKPNYGYNERVSAVSAVQTSLGPVIAYTNRYNSESRGVYLLLLNEALGIRGLKIVNDATFGGFNFQPKVAWNGETISVAWKEQDHSGARLFVRQFDVYGNPVTGAQILSESLFQMSNIRPTGQGFFVAFSEMSQHPSEVKLAFVPTRGVAKGARTVYAENDLVRLLELAETDNGLRLLMSGLYDDVARLHILDIDSATNFPDSALDF